MQLAQRNSQHCTPHPTANEFETTNLAVGIPAISRSSQSNSSGMPTGLTLIGEQDEAIPDPLNTVGTKRHLRTQSITINLRQLELSSVSPVDFGQSIAFAELKSLTILATSPVCDNFKSLLTRLLQAPRLNCLSISFEDPSTPNPECVDDLGSVSVRDLLEPLISSPTSEGSMLEELRIVGPRSGTVTVEDEDIKSIAQAFRNLRVLHLDCQPQAATAMAGTPSMSGRAGGDYSELPGESLLTCYAFEHLARATRHLSTLCLPAFSPYITPMEYDDMQEGRADSLAALKVFSVVCRRPHRDRVTRAFSTLLQLGAEEYTPPLEESRFHKDVVPILKPYLPSLDVEESLEAIRLNGGFSCPAVKRWRAVLHALQTPR